MHGMRSSAWGRILAGYTPALSIEITRECPLRCPGCYAYGDDHLGGDLTLREVRDFKGQELDRRRASALVDKHKPLHVSIVGGEPLVRYRELEHDPARARRRAASTRSSSRAPSAKFPTAWATIPRMHDRRLDRRPAARARRAPHAGHLRPHPEAHRRAPDHRCTARSRGSRSTGPAISRSSCGSGRRATEVRKIWISLYTPQIGEISDERLTPADRQRVVADLMALRLRYPEARGAEGADRRLRRTRPRRRTSASSRGRRRAISADLTTRITPCQFGGAPDCANCGCIASAGLAAVARHQLLGFVPVGAIFTGSVKVGERIAPRCRPARSVDSRQPLTPRRPPTAASRRASSVFAAFLAAFFPVGVAPSLRSKTAAHLAHDLRGRRR